MLPPLRALLSLRNVHYGRIGRRERRREEERRRERGAVVAGETANKRSASASKRATFGRERRRLLSPRGDSMSNTRSSCCCCFCCHACSFCCCCFSLCTTTASSAPSFVTSVTHPRAPDRRRQVNPLFVGRGVPPMTQSDERATGGRRRWPLGHDESFDNGVAEGLRQPAGIGKAVQRLALHCCRGGGSGGDHWTARQADHAAAHTLEHLLVEKRLERCRLFKDCRPI